MQRVDDQTFKARLETALASDWPSARIASFYGVNRRTVTRMRAARYRAEAEEGTRTPRSTTNEPQR
jgi:hypothetical protein